MLQLTYCSANAGGWQSTTSGGDGLQGLLKTLRSWEELDPGLVEFLEAESDQVGGMGTDERSKPPGVPTGEAFSRARIRFKIPKTGTSSLTLGSGEPSDARSAGEQKGCFADLSRHCDSHK